MVAAISAQGSHFETFAQLRGQFLRWTEIRFTPKINPEQLVNVLTKVGVVFEHTHGKKVKNRTTQKKIIKVSEKGFL
jgi:hypothetical protein